MMSWREGVELFTFKIPVCLEMCNTYYLQIRQAIRWLETRKGARFVRAGARKVPAKVMQFMMYVQLEEEYMLAKRAMSTYDRATQVGENLNEDKFEMFTIYVAKTAANYSLTATHPIYERALEAHRPQSRH